jgi:hypothetical protein
MQTLNFVKTYLDDLLIVSTSTFEDHLQKIEKVLEILSEHGLRCNAEKSKFCTDSIEYLGYWVTREGIQPMPNKINAIKEMTAPTTRKQLRRFIGLVNYYRDMWPKRSELLAPLTDLTSKNKTFKWTEVHQKSFEAVKVKLCTEVMLAYPDFTQPFHIYTDASDFQLGAVIMQNGKPLAFYSRKLNSAQRNYTTGEQELLSIVETLREFRNILLGHKIIVHTDHKNLTYEKCTSDRVMRWRLFLEEYGPEFRYIQGNLNVVADALSRLDKDEEMSNEKPKKQLLATFLAYQNINKHEGPMDKFEYAECFGGSIKDQASDYRFPMELPYIAEMQKKDKYLEKQVMKKHSKYEEAVIEKTVVFTYQGKIYVPVPLRKEVIAWYHQYLCHPGVNRTEQTIRQTMYWPGLTEDVKKHVKKCLPCQMCKKTQKPYGHLPPKEAEVEPWQEVHVDLVGPWKVKTPTGVKKLQAFTAIDPATGWFEVVDIKDKSAGTVMDAFHEQWLCRYPRPTKVVFDNGSEFKSVFKEMCTNLSIVCKPTTSYNPQGNAIVERIHQVMGNMLRSFELEDRELDQDNPWSEFLQACAFGIRSTHHTTLQASPGQLVFGRDMIHNLPFVADWNRIKTNKQKLINKSNARENNKRLPYKYKKDDQVLLYKPGIRRKLSTPKEGPYQILKIHSNGTVRIRRGIIQETVNIRRLEPFFE